MRKLALSALFVMLFFGTALAHDGALSLYKTITAPGNPVSWVCHQDIGFLQTDTISIYYIKDMGPDLGKAVEFRLVSSNPSAIFIGVTWNPGIPIVVGDLDSGVSATATQCLGAGETVVFIADVYVFFTDATSPAPTFTVRIVEDPGAQPPAVNITICDEANTLYSVLGGTFVFNGSCNPGVQPKSWGAIKELFH
jgi:hypothetical protein